MKFNKSSHDYVEIFRFDNKVFFCKPYNSDAYDHIFEFIDVEVTDLTLFNQSILKEKVHTPRINDTNWSGCFCFLSEFAKNITKDDGPLSMRKGHKLNVALLPRNTIIWVRNCSYLGEADTFYNEFTYQIEHEGIFFWTSNSQSYNCYCWVRMSVELALERIKLWKTNHEGYEPPEWLTEFYLMEEQLDMLYPLSLWDRLTLSVQKFKKFIIKK
ncbi:hypothetical protein [Bacillus thuringiensis]|nr:hypothetical protein [Bacillus thuringiensis]